jgi:hypothetical protein
MQSALAIGVATLGSVFLSYEAPGSLGMRDAFLLVLGVQTAMALLVAVTVRGLPQPGRAQPEPDLEPALEPHYVEAA